MKANRCSRELFSLSLWWVGEGRRTASGPACALARAPLPTGAARARMLRARGVSWPLALRRRREKPAKERRCRRSGGQAVTS